MKSSKSADVVNEVDLWNLVCLIENLLPLTIYLSVGQHFFHARRMNVVLMRGEEQLSGKKNHEHNSSSPHIDNAGKTGVQPDSVPVDEKARRQESDTGAKDSFYRLIIRPF